VTAYIDTSALLRLVLREPGALEELRSYDALVSSELIAVESCRTIDRLRLQGSLTTEEAAERLKVVTEWLEAIDLVLLRPPVLSRACEPLPMPLGTLDAIHLVTALIWRDRMGSLSVVATHDTSLGLAARAFGFEVRGEIPKSSTV
jgi:predicted nucleic acid-binding protein